MLTDGSEILINLDRFDPGTTSKTDGNLPSIAFPSDVVVPFKVVKNKNNHINFNNKTKEHFCSAIEVSEKVFIKIKSFINFCKVFIKQKLLAQYFIYLYCSFFIST